MRRMAAGRYGRWLVVCASALGSTAAGAAGFALLEQSVKGLGAAFSNSAAVEDASTVFFNPAGLTELRGTQIQAAGHVIAPSATFRDGGSALSAPPGAALIGPNGGEAGVVALAPNLYLHHQIESWGNGRAHFGFGINAPFALKTDSDEGWVGRYHALTSSVRTLNFTPSLSYELSDRLSIGAGASAQRIDARLTKAIDQSTVCLGLAGAGAVPGGAGTCVGLGLGVPAAAAADANSDLRGARDWSFGWNVGVLWKPWPSTRVGLHYRSKISHELEGDAVLSGVNPNLAAVTVAVPGVTGLVNQAGTAKITLPESASLHVYHALNDRWAVHGDISWTRWSRFQELTVNFADGTRSTDPQDWDNSLRYSGGVTFRPDSKWTLRAGLGFDESPIPSATRRTPRIPDEDRTWVSIGASYEWNDRWSVDAAFTHLFVDDPEVRNVETTTGHVLVGRYEAEVDMGAVQVIYRF